MIHPPKLQEFVEIFKYYEIKILTVNTCVDKIGCF